MAEQDRRCQGDGGFYQVNTVALVFLYSHFTKY